MELNKSFIARLTVLLIFLATAFVTNIIHIILLTFIKPFSRRIYYQLVQYNNWTFMAQSIFIYQYWSSSEVTFYCKQADYDTLRHEKTFIIANHSHPINILLMMVTLNHFGRLGNDISFGMTCFKYIPLVGWHIYLAGHILLQKSFARDKKMIERRLREVADNPQNVWVVLLPEGDQFNTENHSKAVRYALKMEMQPLMHQLTPRCKAFTVTYEELKKLAGYSVVNCHVAYGRAPKFSNLLQGRKIQAKIFLERMDFDDVEPTFDGIYKLFKRQDELHEKFLKFNDFNENGNVKEVTAIKIQKDPRVLKNFIAWTIIFMCVVIGVILWTILKAFKADFERYSVKVVMIKMLMDSVDGIAAVYRSFSS